MCPGEIKAGLRIDVDTLRGTRLGVPGLLHVLARRQLKATFFFSVGPDNMGRHLWRLLRPAFFVKMVRNRAVSLYGWDILLRGTLWPGAMIGRQCAAEIRQAAEAGHEIGLHAWDHHRWQSRLKKMNGRQVWQEMDRGREVLENIIGRPVHCAAAPAWRITDTALKQREKFAFHYNSDCRGHSVFYPLVAGRPLSRPQVPTTLPTYDELIGRNGITLRNYNEHLIKLFRPGRLNVLTIHAEAEGISCLGLFQDFLQKARQQGITFAPLMDMLNSGETIGTSAIVPGRVDGRDGWISSQETMSRP